MASENYSAPDAHTGLSDHCSLCGRPLTNYHSKKIGVGPICEAKHHKEDEDMYKDQFPLFGEHHADFTVQYLQDGSILLTDIGHTYTRTITNDAENVIARLYEMVGDLSGKKVLYRDSMGRVDELVVRNNKFVEFRAGPDYVGRGLSGRPE